MPAAKRQRARNKANPNSPLPTNEEGLTDRQEAFVNEYCIDWNLTKAAIRAGYKPSNAFTVGTQLISKKNVQIMIEKRKRELEHKYQLTQEGVLEEIRKLAYQDIRGLYREDGSMKNPHEWDDETAAAIAGVEVEELYQGRGDDRERAGHIRKVRKWPKVEALLALAKIVRLMPEKEITVKGQINHAHAHVHAVQVLTEEQLMEVPIEVRRKWLEDLKAKADSDPIIR